MENKYTKPGQLRGGFDYQDIVALDLLVEMLEKPTKYKWIKVEADDFDYLDDVVALQKDNKIIAKQVKFTTHPDKEDSLWTWEDFLKERKSKNGNLLPSLIKKWHDSLNDISKKYDIAEASFITNGHPDEDIQHILNSDHIVFDKIPPSIKKQISQQTGGTKKGKFFFNNFLFNFNHPVENWEADIETRFHHLGGSSEGWNNLKQSVRNWMKYKGIPTPNREIHIEHVRKASLWNQLAPMPQGFSLPDDYVLPSDLFHNSITQKIQQSLGTCVVISGTPGVGKSTYLSYLYKQLRDNSIPVVRHHYFLSIDDHTVGRFISSKVIESLMADLKNIVPEEILPSGNNIYSCFPKWLDCLSEYYANGAHPLVIIIDGLDHVWREQNNIDELISLFDCLLPVRKGISLIIGTQEVADDQIPKRLLLSAPKKDWFTINYLEYDSLYNWLKINNKDIAFQHEDKQRRENELNDIATALYSKCNGHPLLMRYLLKTLIERDIPVNESSINELECIPHKNIESYYNQLWQSIGNEGHYTLGLIAHGFFPWPENGLFETLSLSGYNPQQALKEFKNIRHLLRNNGLGWVPFHNSISVYVKNTSEYSGHKNTYTKHVIEWLDGSAPQYWKWAYLWVLKAEYQDPQSLITNPDRSWVIDSLSKGYPRHMVSEIMRKSALLALNKNFYEKFAEIALLRDYVGNYYHLIDSRVFSELIFSQLFAGEEEYLKAILLINIDHLDENGLKYMAEYAYSTRDFMSVTIPQIYSQTVAFY